MIARIRLISSVVLWFNVAHLASAPRAFMQQLPDAFAKHGVQILNSKGEFKMNQTYHPWIHFCKRVPNFFEIQASGKSGKEYANAVYFKLLELQPTDKTADKALKSLATFLCNVDKIAFRVISI